MQYLKEYRPSDYLIPQVELTFELDASRTLVISRLSVQPNPEITGELSPLQLHGEELELLEIKLNGRQLLSSEYSVDSHHLTLSGLAGSELSKPFTLEISCAISPEKNHHLQGLYLSQTLLCTQCEAEGFRHITYFLDRPDVLSHWSVRLRGDKKTLPFLLAGGDLQETKDLENGRHESYWIDPWPKPSYLFALAAGPLFEIHDRYKTLSGKSVDLFLYCEPHNRERLAFALEALKRSMLWDEEHFGLEYDLSRFQIVAVDSFNMGAMENKGLNIFNAKCLLGETRATTDDEFRRIEAIIAHEYFHNWTGNRITCRDWFQLTLKEGLTVFRDQQFSSTFHSPGVLRLEQVQTLFSSQFPEDAGAMAHPIQPLSYEDINNFYTPTVYEKGAEVIRMMHTLLGSKFRSGMDCYFNRHDGQAVTTEDFIKALEDGSGIDLSAMRPWYWHYQTPHLECTRGVDEETGMLTLSLSQSPTPSMRGESEPLCMPLQVAIWNPETGEKLVQQLLLLNKWQTTFSFDIRCKNPLISINRNYSCPIILHDDHSEKECLALAKMDDDPIVRWMSSQQLLKQIYKRYLDSSTLDSSGWIEFVDATLHEKSLDSHIKALLVRPAQPQEILEWSFPWNLEAAIAFYDLLNEQTAKALQKELWAIYKENHYPLNSDFNALNSSHRHLKHAAMEYLTWTEDASVFETLYQQLQEATCMTDEAGAYRLLTSQSNLFQQAAIETYEKRWHRDNLTWPRWFANQATSRDPETLSRCESLFNHPHFNCKIPNQARALIAGLASNCRFFHGYRSDIAKGYRWLGEKILLIDSFNSQLAAKLAKSFSIYTRVTGERKEVMKQVLKQLCSQSTLSKSTREILQRCLESSPS